MSIFDHRIYVELRDKRIKAIVNYYGKDWFKDKKILELGCGNADIGNSFYEMGAIVTSTDARDEHLKTANKKYPHIKTILFDLELPDWPFEENYDLILHILEEFNAPNKIDFLSLDVEGVEFNILKTFPFDKYMFHYMCVEHNEGYDGVENRNKIRNLLISKGYNLIKKAEIDDFYENKNF